MNRSVYVKGAFLSVIGSIFWAISGTCGQFLFENRGFEAGWLVSVRLLAAGTIMLLLSFRSQGKRTIQMWKEKKNARELVLYGLIGMMGVQYAYFMAIYTSNAATATVLQNLGPTMILLYMVLRTRKAPSKTEVTAVILALVGIFLLVTHGNLETMMISESALIWGLLAAAALAFYSIFPRRMLAEWGTLVTNGWGMFIGGVAISFIFQPWNFGGGIWDAASVLCLLGVVFLGTILSFFCYLEGVRLIGSTRASLYACVEPLAAAIIGILWLHIRFDFMDWIGSALIISTIFILSIKPKGEEEKEEGKGSGNGEGTDCGSGAHRKPKEDSPEARQKSFEAGSPLASDNR